ncbi:hypothetical protein [Ammoniphilus sp. 3BR4]|uniref:hypothetical protein n=1 Tax=Ammoniphilus sp. 3BR4 TaxID=3158265 RepID=UPI003465CE3B
MSKNSSSQNAISAKALFEPFHKGNLKLSGRIVMAPMTRGFSPNGIPGPDVADYTAKLAKTPDELARFLAPLADAGVDVFHCSTRRFWEPEFEGSELNLAGWTKKLTGKPTITVGSVGLDGEFTKLLTEGASANTAHLDGLIERLERGEFDLVAVGRALMNDPEWASKVRDGRTEELIPFSAESRNTLF